MEKKLSLEELKSNWEIKKYSDDVSLMNLNFMDQNVLAANSLYE